MLLVFSTPLVSHAQSHARFSVEPSNPARQAGVGAPGTEFTFTADVSDATSYRIEFDAEHSQEYVLQPDTDSRVTFKHTYDEAGRYVAKLIASRPPNEEIELSLNVRVELPPPPPQPAEEHARFTVSPGDPNDWASFTFTADVSNAESYEVNFGDGNVESNLAPEPDGRAIVAHSYSGSGDYEAVMNALRNSGEEVLQTVSVLVEAPQPPPSTVFFSVTPSDPAIHEDIEFPWGDYTFTADVADASEYQFHFGDGSEPRVVPETDGKVTVRHVYQEARTYDAFIIALRNSGEAIREDFSINVTAPQIIPPKRNWWPWILLAAAIVWLLHSLWTLLNIKTGNPLVSFESKVEPGKVRVSSSSAAKDSVSMRLRPDVGRIALAVNSGEQQ